MAEDFITTRQAQKILRLDSFRTVTLALRQGRLKGRKFGRMWMVSRASVKTYKVNRTNQQSARNGRG